MTDKVVSYSLWGDNPKYTIGAIRNAEGVAQLYDGWKCRIYFSDVPKDIIDELHTHDCVELVDMGNGNGNWTGMFWRFLAADGDDIMISRDTDSRITPREVAAVNEWLASDGLFHIMRDHPYHGTPILGGMWGARGGILKGLADKIDAFRKDDRWQIDQDFLKTIIYPEVRNYAFTHDPIFEHKLFPTPRLEGEYVGKAFNADETEFAPSLSNLVKAG